MRFLAPQTPTDRSRRIRRPHPRRERPAGPGGARTVTRMSSPTPQHDDSTAAAADAPETAQDVLAALLRTRVAPALRALDFRGSGQVFELRDEKWWALIGFQRSRYSHAAELEFTVNVVAIRKDQWEARRAEHRLGRRPTPSDTGHAGALRLDQVDDRVLEPWWTVRVDSDPAAVAAQVLTTIETVVLPWLHARIGRTDAPHTLAVPGGDRGPAPASDAASGADAACAPADEDWAGPLLV